MPRIAKSIAKARRKRRPLHVPLVALTFDPHDPESLRRALMDYLGKAPRGHRVYGRSGSRRIWFYWFMAAHRLGVTIRRIKTTRFSVPRVPAAEALALDLRRTWVCRRCGATFTPRGRQQFCSSTCKTAWHVGRFRVRAGQQARIAARLAAEKAERARPETQAELQKLQFEQRGWDRTRRARIDKAEARAQRRGREPGEWRDR